MKRILQFGLAATLVLGMCVTAAFAQSRNALVIGNSAYQSAPPLKTPSTDAAVVTETLRAAGYDVTDLRDVKQADIGQIMRDFLDKAAEAGPDGAAFVYYSGYAAQSGGENYLVPIDAVINNDGDVADEAFRLNDLIGELAKTPLAARVVVLDASRDHKFGAASGKPVAKGLAMGDTTPELLLAFAAAPGAIAIDGDGDYSIYTGALVTLMRQPGLTLEQILKAVRLQINQTTGGVQTPWMAGDLSVDVSLFAATPSAPEVQTLSGMRIPSKEDRDVSKDMMRGLGPDQAYAAAVEEDSLEAYQWFVELYPKHQFAAQVWEIIETRREAVLWRRTLAQNTTRAYWNYLKRYPNGAHVSEAQEQLEALSAPPSPPVNYVAAPEPLPPDYSDEAVGIGEIVPEGYDAPPTVFDVLTPLFIPRGPRDFGDRRRQRFVPDRIPIVRGDPVGSFTKKTGRDGRDGRITRDGTSRHTGKKTGVIGGKTPIDKGSNIGGRKIRDGRTTPTGGTQGGKKTGVTLPTGKTGGRTPITTTTPTRPGGLRGTPTPDGTLGTRRGGVTLPTTGTRPTTRGTPPTGVGVTGRPTTGPTPVRPTSPGPTARPTTPGGVTSGRPGLPPVPGSGTVRPTTSPTSPTVTHRPGLPPTPGSGAVRPTTPQHVPTVTQRPGLPPVPTAHPTTPTGRPTAPTGRPTALPPTAHPTPPTAHPTTPTVRPTQPTVRPTTTPTVRPTTPTVRPTVTPPRPPPPTVRPTPQRPTQPIARPVPQRPAQPVMRPTPPRPAPVARPMAPPRPAPVARPASPPRAAAPPPRAPSCSMVGGKRVCR